MIPSSSFISAAKEIAELLKEELMLYIITLG
jgi:hypothetical protein